MADLIARLEAATGADRELDAEIALEAGWIQVGEAGTWALPGEPDIYAPSCPRFTASVDAALTLVPEGWLWRLGFNGTEHCFTAHPPMAMLKTPEWNYVEDKHKIDALAICLAALRARERG